MNKQQALLLFSLSFFTACVERGYNVTSNISIHTVTAERITSIKPGNISKEQPNIEEKMLLDVKKTLKKQKVTASVKREIPRIENKKSNILTTPIEKEKRKEKQISVKKSKKIIPIVNKNNDFDENNLLLEAARKSRELRKLKLKEAFELKKLARIKANKSASERFKNAKVNPNLVVASPKDQALQREKERELQRKIAQENQRLEEIKKAEEEKLKQALKKRELEAAQQRSEKSKRQQELAQQRSENLKKQQELAQQRSENLKKQQELARKRAEEQRHQLEQAQKAKAKHPVAPKVSKKAVSATELLKFHPIDKVYQKFGTSEVHGRVIYLDKAGREVHLNHTKIYLLPMSATLNHWYSSYYLKNKKNKNNTTVTYLNKTSLSASKKFEFFGVPEGSYYVIIESIGHNNEKIYISKKITVGKYKKVMGVFSKKL